MTNGHTITIRQMTSNDHQLFPAALELLNRTQGRDLFDRQYMTERTSDPRSFAVGAFAGTELVGVGVAQLISEFEYYQPFDPNISSELKGKTVGSFATLCVHERFRGRGLGKQLSQKRLEWLKERKCEVILGVSWMSGLPQTSDRGFETLGFKTVKAVSNFYRDSSLERQCSCPGCQKSPCVCSAIFYRLDWSL
ncbi:MAG: GNAT family N-acetyltransferase [Candidatus Zixiibacteriota bacterium]|nr:MAG: GNAT family N-acetyltransferase [candidate division Zixibacteria bacterium]